eukprot:TRINITY_DN5641_c0_g1_i1.p1 TRINITY_DN5641_c0_g1~~TRINITY_DN5641_c0_g1_i1.p1  ORF type:complete len:289 (+),score=58.72 TRINITY_DN5641_c0_g1_i1:69-935(+)
MLINTLLQSTKSYRKTQNRNYHKSNSKYDKIPKWEDFRRKRREKKSDERGVKRYYVPLAAGCLLLGVGSYYLMDEIHDAVESNTLVKNETEMDIQELFEKLGDPYPVLFESNKLTDFVFPHYIEDSIDMAMIIIYSPYNKDALSRLKRYLGKNASYSLSGAWKIRVNGVLTTDNEASVSISMTVPIHEDENNCKLKLIIDTFPELHVLPSLSPSKPSYAFDPSNVYKATIVVKDKSDPKHDTEYIVFKNPDFAAGPLKEQKKRHQKGFFDHSHSVRLRKVKKTRTFRL